MNIGLFGYGKMGKMIEKIAMERGHTIVAKFDVGSPTPDYSDMDVAIDFSSPDAAFENIKGCLEKSVPVISGTTGWLDSYDKAVAICKKHSGAFIYASNFSLGVNIFFELNSYLAGMMNSLEQYKPDIVEIHHVHKLDAPSGTAITLAEGIIANSDYDGWALDGGGENEIPIFSKREGEIAGTHTVSYRSEIDNIEIKHKAHGRMGFALGAVIAAEWIPGKEGVFGMKDVLNLRR